MLKICMIVPDVYPVPAIRGGAVETLVDLFARINEKCHEVDLTIVSPWDEKAYLESTKYKYTKFVYIRRKWIDSIQDNRYLAGMQHVLVRETGHSFVGNAYLHRLYRKIQSMNFDWIVIEGGSYEVNGYLIKKIGYDRILLHLHGKHTGSSVLNKWFSHIICVSNYIARCIVMSGKVNMKHVDVLKNGIKTENFQIKNTAYSRKDERAKYGFADDDVVFAYWGRLLPEKGVRELLKAFVKVLQTRTNTRLLVIGSAAFDIATSTDYEKELANLCTGLQDKIIFTGFIQNTELWRVLHAADIAVFPSICDDAAPLTGIEAGAAGLPYITTNVGGVSEYANDGGAVILDWSLNFVDDLANAMIKLADDEPLRKRMGALAYENAREYNEINYYDNYVNILKKYTREREEKFNQ